MTDAENLGCCYLFWAPLRPQFGKYGLFNAGGSYWSPAWLMLAFRIAVTAGLIATLIWASIFGHVELIIGTSLWLPCLLLLCTCSYLYYRGYSEPRWLADVTIPIYQIMFSLSIFAFPMFIGFPAHTGRLIEEAVFISAAIGLACVDILALGSRVRFRIQIIWLPMLVIMVVYAIGLAILVAVVTIAGIPTVLGISVAGAIISAIIYAIVWSTISSVVVVLITRATFCCFPFRYEEEEAEATIEAPEINRNFLYTE